MKKILIPVLLIGTALALIGVFGWNGIALFLADWWWFEDLSFLPEWTMRTGFSILSFALPALLCAMALILWPTLARGRRLKWYAALFIGAAACAAGVWGVFHRDALLLFLAPVSYGVRDPVFRLDAWTWAVKLPLFRDLAAAFALLCGLFFTLEFFPRRSKTASPAEATATAATQQIRLSGLQTILAIFLTAGLLSLFLLGRMEVLVAQPHPRVGAGFTEVNGYLLGGLIWALLSLLLAAFFALRWRKRLTLAGIVVPGLISAVFYGVLALGLPAMQESGAVRPNEVAIQAPYAKKHIEMTRAAFGLDFEKKSATDTGPATGMNLSGTERIHSARLWDFDVWLSASRQMREYRNYFELADADPSLYVLSNGSPSLCLIAARELADGRLPPEARGWDNLHLRYTHGLGAVVSPAEAVTENGSALYLQGGIDSVAADPAFTLTQPRIYFGERTSNYALVSTKELEFDQAGPEGRVESRYEASNGVRMNGFLRRPVFSTVFHERNLSIGAAFTKDTRILYRRLVGERVRKLFPLASWDDDAYPVIADGRIYWIIDGYSHTARFPLSRRYSTPWGKANCVRSPIRAAVDAYTGETRFALTDEHDPFAAAWRWAYPGFFRKPVWPPVAAHFRVPYPLARLQAEVLLAFHVDNPVSFYSSDDTWEFPKRVADGKPVLFDIYYALSGDSSNTVLAAVQPFVPLKRDNLAGWVSAADGRKLELRLAGDSDGSLGPMQVEAVLNQDDDFSRLVAGWSLRGAKVVRGNIQYMPFGGDLLALEPIYLVSLGGSIPRLARVAAVWKGKVFLAKDLLELAKLLSAPGAWAVKLDADIRNFEASGK